MLGTYLEARHETTSKSPPLQQAFEKVGGWADTKGERTKAREEYS